MPDLDAQQEPAAQPTASAFSPFRHTAFAILWSATVLGNVGSFMRDVASSWLVADLSNSPAAVAMIQAAGSLPAFLLAIAAGAFSDIFDRRQFMIAMQILLASVSASLAILVVTGGISVPLLIALTFLGGIGAALAGPTWQAIVPDLVPRSSLKEAVALGSLGFNISRAIGPALGGALLASAGAAAVYGADVLSYVFVIAALLWWRAMPKGKDELAENFGGAVRAGMRYVRASPEMRRLMWRAALFLVLANVAWALLALVARDILGGGASFYGALLGAIGAGAIIGAIILPKLRLALGIDGLVLVASLVIGIAISLFSLGPTQGVGLALAFVFGVAWVAVLTIFGATVQAILPNWVRGRGLAVYMMTFNGALVLGSLSWGAVGEIVGVPMALLAGGIALCLSALLAYPFRLPAGEADLTPAEHWPEPGDLGPAENDRGPVLITITYEIDPAEREEFLKVLRRFKQSRQRDGAYAWGVAEDSEAPVRILEWFLVESWAEHLRQHRRVSKADADVQNSVRAFHKGDQPPVVRHYLGL